LSQLRSPARSIIPAWSNWVVWRADRTASAVKSPVTARWKKCPLSVIQP
jgi:hypothetical protein